jgi:cobaltochelatase CobS
METSTPESKITCMICHGLTHSIKVHIDREHSDWSVERYKEQWPDAPLFSDELLRKMEEKKISAIAAKPGKVALHELFGVGAIKAAMNAQGNAIPITVLGAIDDTEMIPKVDEGHVYELDSLKNLLLAVELNIPLYVWGHAGTGKTTVLEQICARTRRALIRVQHTLNTEESHILGQWTAQGGATKFELGPLALAMKRGWVYLADEYDFAMPSILAVYQPVLEGKSLVIKEADHANRVIHPHPNFRFMATGNTNGSGDETGLYQGTSIQNAANYDRFGVVVQMNYMKSDMEIRILVNQARVSPEDAKKIVDFATRVREQYDGAKISNTISPRTLINAAKIGIMKGSYRAGIALTYTNKLSRVDREVVDGVAQRIFGA